MSYYNNKGIGWIIFLIVFIIFWFLLGPYLVMIAWNWLMPQLFAGVGLLTWWKSFVLCVMVRLMLGTGFNVNKK